jgi:hypothetical protein
VVKEAATVKPAVADIKAIVAGQEIRDGWPMKAARCRCIDVCPSEASAMSILPRVTRWLILDRVFADGTEIGLVELIGAGLVDNPDSRVKILGDGDLTKKLIVSAHKFSKSAEQKISGCGGTIKIVA